MKKILGIVVLGLLFSGNAYAHEKDGKAHEPYICKLEQDRSAFERTFCKQQANNHRMCKLDEICALIRIEVLEKELKELKESIKY